MLWLYERIRQQTEKLKDHIKCNRCGVYFHKDHGTCNICSQLNDDELKTAIDKRRTFRMTLGKYMFIGAALTLLAMLVLASK